MNPGGGQSIFWDKIRAQTRAKNKENITKTTYKNEPRGGIQHIALQGGVILGHMLYVVVGAGQQHLDLRHVIYMVLGPYMAIYGLYMAALEGPAVHIYYVRIQSKVHIPSSALISPLPIGPYAIYPPWVHFYIQFLQCFFILGSGLAFYFVPKYALPPSWVHFFTAVLRHRRHKMKRLSDAHPPRVHQLGRGDNMVPPGLHHHPALGPLYPSTNCFWRVNAMIQRL